MRITIAGLLGGIAMFVFTSIAHVATPLGQIGIGHMENAAPLLSQMVSTLGSKPGVFLFPEYDAGKPDAAGDYVAKLASNPNGFLVYHPPGGKGAQAREFVVEFLTELVEAFIAAFVVANLSATSLLARVGFTILVGVAGAITTNVSYWNWYGFPTNYTVAYSLIEIGGYAVAGLVIAAVLHKRD